MTVNETGGQLPLVSICCLTYNHEPFIRDALEGFLMQETTFPYEIVIYDDASTDRTQDIIREYTLKYPDLIRPMLQTENQYSKGITNPSGAFNFPRARGKYIAMCEGDDYWTDPHKLQMQVDFLEKHSGCALCIHSARILTIDGSFSDRRIRPYKGTRRLSPEDIIDKPQGYAMASLVFPSIVVKELPSYYTNCPVGDIPQQLMAASMGWGFYIDRDMSVYRVGVPTSWTTQEKKGDYISKQRRYVRQMKHMYREFDQATGGRFHGAVESAARRIWYLTKVNTRCYQIVLSQKYRRYFDELTFRTKFYICMEARLPWLYKLLNAAAQKRRRYIQASEAGKKKRGQNT